MADLDDAIAHHHAGRFDAAETIYQNILRSAPEDVDALHLLGLVALDKGDSAKAVTLIEKAIALKPDISPLHNSLGNALKAQGDLDGASAKFRRALTLDSSLLGAYINLGTVLRAQGKPDEAISTYRKALTLEPNLVEALNNLGYALLDIADFDGAVAAIKRCIELQPQRTEAVSNLAYAYKKMGHWKAALACRRQIVALEPKSEDGHLDLGLTLQHLRQFSEAEACFRHVLDLDPGDIRAKNNLAILFLLQGDFASAWQWYSARDSIQNCPHQLWQDPLAKGLHGKSFFLRKDQGLGDELFFLRFAPEIKRRGAMITYWPGDKIASIVARLPFLDHIALEDVPNPGDIIVSIGDLPYLVGMKSRRDIPSYLKLVPLPERLAAMEARLEALGPPPYFGFTWRAGIPDITDLLFKEVPIAGLGRTMKGIAGTCLALQRLPEAGEIEAFSAAMGRPVHDFTDLNDDLEDMLALLSLINDYVTVSNTNVHLRTGVGAMCRVLVPFPPDYRWMTEGDESPWFLGTRTYRQGRDWSWDGAFSRLAEDLLSAHGPA